ncbi:DNA replication/repair protein RecF [Candidatus Peregrinibacteria bacterium]|nr:DNA replication/repair protein RecF [Candidatus Peregrinibacteria bacterium]
MRLQRLSLEHFRSYEALSLDFGRENVHVFIGHNGAGKTNILESVSVLSLVKSFLAAEDDEAVRWDQQHFRVRAECSSDDGTQCSAEVVSQLTPRRQKACFVNDVRRSVGEMVGTLPSVSFLPQDLELFTGAPAQRRAFLDRLLSQVSPEYLPLLLTYQKILKQRNALLKHIAQGSAERSDLPVWDERLADTGAAVTVHRLELVGVLQCTLARELAALGEDWPDAQMRYERKGDACALPDIRNEILGSLQENLSRDCMLQSTGTGPHRDDWTILVGGRSIATFASRGQQRTAVLALLELQTSYLELRRGEKPVVLLDDVFSELDDAHQTALLQSFADHQVLITATHVPPALGSAVLWHVGEGRVSRSESVKV